MQVYVQYNLLNPNLYDLIEDIDLSEYFEEEDSRAAKVSQPRSTYRRFSR